MRASYARCKNDYRQQQHVIGLKKYGITGTPLLAAAPWLTFLIIWPSVTFRPGCGRQKKIQGMSQAVRVNPAAASAWTEAKRYASPISDAIAAASGLSISWLATTTRKKAA